MSVRNNKGIIINNKILTPRKPITKPSIIPASPKVRTIPRSDDGAVANSNKNHQLSISVKSKYTERKAVLEPNRTRSLRLDLQSTIASASKQIKSEHSNKQTKLDCRPIAQPATPKPRQWNRREPKVKTSLSRISEKIEQRHCQDMSVQTNELEILNYDHLIGDIKFILPTKSLITEIEKCREVIKKKTLLNTQRQFEDHAEGEEEHLTDLKEFLEKAVVTRRNRKPKDSLDIDRKLIHSMDEILNREIRRTESITNIKGRIKKKEKELLSLFEKVENVQCSANKN